MAELGMEEGTGVGVSVFLSVKGGGGPGIREAAS
jgi:methyl coenzyme M reductase beta subunit